MAPHVGLARATSLHDIERQLTSICRRAVQATLLAGSLSPAAGCANAAPRRDAATGAAANRIADAGAPSSDGRAGSANGGRALPAIFAMETETPVPPPAPSAQFVAFPCGTPPFAPGEQERIWNDEALYNRFAQMQSKLEYGLRARSLNVNPPVDYLAVRRVFPPEGVRELGHPFFHEPMAEHGTPCAGAQDGAECEAELKRQADAVVAKERCDDRECRPFLYVYAQTTRGGKVRTYIGKKGLVELFGPIDTPTEAWFLLASEQIFEGFACGEPEFMTYRTLPGAHEVRGARYTSRCRPLTMKELTYRVDTSAKVRLVQAHVLSSDPEGCVVSGRRPPGLLPLARQQQTLAGYLARAAHLEAASVHAFEALARELLALAAPASLLEAVRAAQQDERDHARRMSLLAAQCGAAPNAVQVAPCALRSRFELALDNAREGCVRELFGAFVARFQASRAQSPALRATLAKIAADELRHAALAWALADWLEVGLDEEQRREVAAQRRRALAEIRQELAAPPFDLMLGAGLPCLDEALLLATAVESWVQARALA